MAVDFKAKQQEFADFLRDPKRHPAPADVEPRRMAMYRELFFNNVESFLSGNFPVLRSILDERAWLALVQDFFASHAAKTPYFAEIGEEFLTYLQYERRQPDDLPFLLELAHYEWVELALANAKDELIVNTGDFETLWGKKLALSELAWPLVYQYPVHRLAPTFMPATPPEEPTCLVVYRDQEDDVRFLEITSTTYQLLQALSDDGGRSAEVYLERLILTLNPTEPDNIRQAGQAALTALAERHIVRVLD